MKMASFIQEELADVRSRVVKAVPCTEIIGVHQANVQIRLTRTKHKSCICQFQFPSEYPNKAIFIEVKSKVLPGKVIDVLAQVAEAEAKKLLGKPQIISLLKFLNKFIEENPLLVCSDEISKIKKLLVGDEDKFKVKQKEGVIDYRIACRKYFMHFKFTVPDMYPTESVRIEFKGSNFPAILEHHFVAQAVEIARQCVEPPLRKDPKAQPFEAKASLLPVLEYLAGLCVHPFPVESCPCCKKPALSDDPENCETNPNADMFVEWVYCKHIFHHKCLDDYMKTPPFDGGKKCPKCGKRIYHEKWNISAELAEQRWAHKEARRREIDEVTDFLDLM